MRRYYDTSLKKLRDSAWESQGGRCTWCRKDVPKSEATAEHMLPLCRGGSNEQENIRMACSQCNNSRGDAGQEKQDLGPKLSRRERARKRAAWKRRHATSSPRR